MRVTDGLVAGALDASAHLELRLAVSWTPVGTTLRARMGLHNVHALPMTLHAQVLTHKPWKFTAFLMLHGAHLRRLDVNGSHRNRTGVREVSQEAIIVGSSRPSALSAALASRMGTDGRTPS